MKRFDGNSYQDYLIFQSFQTVNGIQGPQNASMLRLCNREDFKLLNAEEIWDTKVSSPPD
jgi:hypothetical protein